MHFFPSRYKDKQSSVVWCTAHMRAIWRLRWDGKNSGVV